MKLKTLINLMDNKQEVIICNPKKVKITIEELKQDKPILETKVINVLLINNELTIFIK